MGLPEVLGEKVRKALSVHRERTGILVLLVPQAQKVFRDPRAIRVFRVQQEPVSPEIKAPLVLSAPKAILAQLVLRALLVFRVRQVRRALPVLKDPRATPEPQAPPVPPVLRAIQAQQEHLARPVFRDQRAIRDPWVRLAQQDRAR